MIKLAVNGIPYSEFISAQLSKSVESLANDFSFTASAVNGFPPFKQGDLVEILVNDQLQITGFIEEVNGTDDEGSHTVSYSGRDKTSDFLDSEINIVNDIKPSDSLTLKKLIELVLSHLNLNLKVIDEVNPAPFNLAEDIIAPQVGEKAFDFVMQYARKRQVLLSSDGEGNIVITRSSPIDSGAILQRIIKSDTNNILTQSWDINGSEVFNKYIHRGQLDPRALNFAGETDIAANENQGAGVSDSSVRQGRQRVVVESESYSNEQLKDRAKWASQIAVAKAVRFSCSSKGHENSIGDIWQENTLVQINSEVANISRKMLLNTITFSEGEGQPTISELEFVEENVYTIDEKLLAQKPAGDQSDIFKTLA